MYKVARELRLGDRIIRSPNMLPVNYFSDNVIGIPHDVTAIVIALELEQDGYVKVRVSFPNTMPHSDTDFFGWPTGEMVVFPQDVFTLG